MPDVLTPHARDDARAARARIRRIFDRRAARFGEVAFLPREIARRMHERLDYIKLAPARALDAGCSPGAALPLMAARAHCGASDAPPARRHWFSLFARSVRARRWPVVQADFAMLPFAADTFD